VSRFKRSLAASCLVLICAAGLAAQEEPPPPSPEDEAIRKKIEEEVERQLKEREAARWTARINPQGGGAFIKSPDGKALFRLYGYASHDPQPAPGEVLNMLVST
jgi:hypothetical protein